MRCCGNCSIAIQNTYIWASSWISGSDLRISSSATVGGTLGVTGATTLQNTLGVAGATTLQDTLTVTGSTTLIGALTASIVSASNWISGSDLRISNSASIGSTLDVTGDTTLNSSLTVNGNTILGNANTDTVTISGDTINLSSTSPTTTIGHTGTTNSALILSSSAPSGDIVFNSNRFIHTSQSLSLQLTKNIGSKVFTSGFAGNGFRINYDSFTDAEFDNLTIRGSMRVYELIINQIRATNGSLFVSSVGKVDSVVELLGNTYQLIFDTGSGDIGHGFLENDLIRAQRVNRNAIQQAGVTQSINGNLVYRSDLIVKEVQDLKTITAITTDKASWTLYNSRSLAAGATPEQFVLHSWRRYNYLTPTELIAIPTTPPSGGMEFVRLGNQTDPYRQGTLYLTSDDSYSPFMDVVDGIASHSDWNNATSGSVKVRIGKISGISSPTFGTLDGYGMWASGSAYLEGGINATTGFIGGWQINRQDIKNDYITISNNATSSIKVSWLNYGLRAESSGAFYSPDDFSTLELYNYLTLNDTTPAQTGPFISLGPGATMASTGIFLSGSGDFNFQTNNNQYIDIS